MKNYHYTIVALLSVALTLPVPQDKIFRLSEGAVEEIPVRPPAA